MAFKMNGSPAKMGTISGTAGHGSALKMRSEEIASAFKYSTNKDDAPPPIPKDEKAKDKKMANKDWKKGEAKAKSSGRDLNALVKELLSLLAKKEKKLQLQKLLQVFLLKQRQLKDVRQLLNTIETAGKIERMLLKLEKMVQKRKL